MMAPVARRCSPLEKPDTSNPSKEGRTTPKTHTQANAMTSAWPNQIVEYPRAPLFPNTCKSTNGDDDTRLTIGFAIAITSIRIATVVTAVTLITSIADCR